MWKPRPKPIIRNKRNNEIKENPDIEYVTMEEIVGKNLIPTELVMYGINEKKNKVEVYIFNKKMTKLKTFESFKNKSKKTVPFDTYAAHQPAGIVSLCGGPEVYYAYNDYDPNYKVYFSRIELECCTEDEVVKLHRYSLKDAEDRRNARFSTFTTVEDIEKFIKDKNSLLKSEAQQKSKIEKKYKSFIDNTVDKSLDF